jgi:RNA polymerase sigma-70 factor (ECF subfamily)
MGLRPRPEIDNEADLGALERIQSTTPDAFSEIVERYTPVLYSLAYRFLGADRDAAREAVQEIFLKVYGSLASFDREKRFFPWLYTIALNYLRSVKRAHRSRPEKRGISLQTPDTAPRPDDLSIAREGERLAQRALDMLPARLREAFLLRQVVGLSTRDVGDVLGVPEATIRTWIFRAREKMKEMLLDSGWE